MAEHYSPSLKQLLFAIALLYIASSCCEAQQADAVQIIARAALCFDNRTVINSCLASMGINVNVTANGTVNGTTSSSNATIFGPKRKKNATTTFCGSPCYGQMMLMTSCIDVVLSNFQFYSPGLMQGVQSIFQMACGGSNNTNNATTSSHVANGEVGASRSSSGDVMVKPSLVHLLVFVLSTCFL
ncbi:hypothetical protein Cni_G04794 [Canna indica]|uniref:DUF7731 domain-containing protein n=1 Tax=Canna indica TaxID=4628 RepID=A0AAQ3JU34_9LILI|nr:hypothetical protein Cni_G04794 [Canna indica]